MVTIREVREAAEKSAICDSVLHALPDWFGIESSIVEYVEMAAGLTFFAACDGDTPIGFAMLKAHNVYTSEVCAMGILQAYHRQGVGKRLIEACEHFCQAHHVEFLTVKTLDASAESASYDKTRAFYQAMGFRPLEVFPLHWDVHNPCLFLAKYVGQCK